MPKAAAAAAGGLSEAVAPVRRRRPSPAPATLTVHGEKAAGHGQGQQKGGELHSRRACWGAEGWLDGPGLLGQACLWTKAVTLETIGKVRIIEPRLGSSGALRGWRSFHPAWGVARQLRQLSPPTTKCLLSFPALGLALPVQHNLLPRPIPAASW